MHLSKAPLPSSSFSDHMEPHCPPQQQEEGELVGAAGEDGMTWAEC